MTLNPITTTTITAMTTNPGISLIFASYCEQRAISLELGMVVKFCLHIFSSYGIPKLTLREVSNHENNSQ